MENNKEEEELTLPQIKVLSHDEETGITEFDVDECFVALVKKQLNLDSEPTEEQVSAFLRDMLEKVSDKKDGWDLNFSE